jgi:peptide/nickel transport system ATP-binding protein
MKSGEILEIANTEDLFTAPKHAYTKSLLQLMPKFRTA